MKNNDQNELKKNIYKAFSEILKSNPNLNSKISQNALNIIQLYNENYAKKINDNLKTKNYKKIQSQKDKQDLIRPLVSFSCKTPWNFIHSEKSEI